MKLKITAVVVIVIALLAGAGCDDTNQAEHAARFRQQASRSGYDIAFAPEDEGRPGTVAGVVRSRDGVRSMFIFSFGPAPDKLSAGFGYGNGAVWFDVGDGLEYWFQPAPAGLARAAQKRANRMRIAIENIACHVTAGRSCFT